MRDPTKTPEPRRAIPPPPDEVRRGRKGYIPSTLPPFVPTPEMPIYPGDIVPEEDQSKLMQADHVFTTAYFEIGDIALRLAEQAPQVDRHKRVVTIAHVYKSVGFFCHRQERTVRLYAETAGFFSPDVRERYSEVPFSTFVLAKTFGERWEEILQYAQDKPWASVDEIRYYFRQVKDKQRVEGDVRFHTPQDGEECADVCKDECEGLTGCGPSVDAVERGKRLISFSLSQLSGSVDALSSIARSDAITERGYQAVRLALGAVADAIKVLREEIEKV